MTTSKTFKKGQKIYQIHTNFGRIDSPDLKESWQYMTVIERTIDACGEKQMTFADFGCDFVFGRLFFAPFQYDPSKEPRRKLWVFLTREDAYSYLESQVRDEAVSTRNTIHYMILRGEFADNDRAVFRAFDNIKTLYRDNPKDTGIVSATLPKTYTKR
jgi:hypothetical protein